MGKLADRLLGLVAPKARVAAGCSVTSWCQDCPAPRSYLGQKVTRVCCLNEGCSTSYGSCGGC